MGLARIEWMVGSPVLLLAVVLAIPSGWSVALGSAVLVVVGLLTLSLLRRVGTAVVPPGLAWWGEPALGGLLAGFACALAWTVLGGPGWGARLSIVAAVGLWMAAAEMVASRDERANALAPVGAFLSLVGFTLLGYLTHAGVLYFSGPPLALIVVLAGHLGACGALGAWGGRISGSNLARLAFVAAAAALNLLAWVDLV